MENTQLKTIVSDISFAIDLNYLIAEAIRDKLSIVLINGKLSKNDIRWSDIHHPLPLEFTLATENIIEFLKDHSNEIVRINIFSSEINKNIIIYFPQSVSKMFLHKKCEGWASIVEI
jgi:hypothetical protein